MTGRALAPAPDPCLTRRKTRQRTWAGWAPCLHPLPSIRTSSETLGDGKSIPPISYPSSSASAFISGQPSISVAQEKIQVVKHSRNKRGGYSDWGTGRLKCILQVRVHHQKDIWISTEIWCIIISISLHVSGGLTKEQTKDKFKIFLPLSCRPGS